MATLNYQTVGSNRLEEAKAFYDALLGSIGMGKLFDHPSGGRLYKAEGIGVFAVLGPYDKHPATVGNGGMVGIFFDTPEEVAAFHAKALSLGGSCEGPPGERGPGAYFAYFRDREGNKFCAYNYGWGA